MLEHGEIHLSHVEDSKSLTATALREKYPSTYTSWRNMKQRRKAGAIIDPRLEAFSDFLALVGPRPSRDHTLDRIDPRNPTYAPKLVRWLDAKGQANNRQTTIILEVDGQAKPLAVWAEVTGQRPDTLRSRHAKGWSDHEVLSGRKSAQVGNPWTAHPWPPDPRKSYLAEQAYQRLGDRGELRIDYYIRAIKQQIEQIRWRREGLYDPCSGDSPPREWLELGRELERYFAKMDDLWEQRALVYEAIKVWPKPESWAGPSRFRRKDEY
ncbi:hypothetical protein [Phreatobacter stygius]|uniref:Uncharacterized protein n=1 Tax=Phreatobacter stygius TaxID=1940610 RepID=A0A4D7B3G2_9HYPH|nr:hypothetical protein [Phreatobacter stygius]QCI64580.1 hypothetical protein E8M01_10270 [Phreatobacter stygius]